VSQPALLRLSKVSKRYGTVQANHDIDLEVHSGSIHAVLGENGAGKSTFVGLISGRMPPSAGEITFDGQPITRLPAHARVARGIAYTFQITSIFANLTCRENILLPAQRRVGPDAPTGKFESVLYSGRDFIDTNTGWR